MGMGLVELVNMDRHPSSRAVFNQSQAIYRALLENLNSSFALCKVRKDQCGNLAGYVFIEVNPAFERQLGIGRADVVGKDIADASFDVHIGIDMMAVLAETAEDAMPRTFERQSEVLRRWFKITVFCPLEDHIVMLLADITRQKELEEKQQNFAYHDLLTGLSSQQMLEDKLMLAIVQAKRSREQLAVALFEVENYMALVEAFGQVTGDELLLELGRRIVGSLRQSDTVARIGENTFVLILPGVKSRTNAVVVANRVLEECSRPLQLREKIVISSGSISLCFFPKDQHNFAEAVSKDQVSLYLSKQRKFPQVYLSF